MWSSYKLYQQYVMIVQTLYQQYVMIIQTLYQQYVMIIQTLYQHYVMIVRTHLFRVYNVPVSFLHLLSSASILSGSSFKNLQ